MNFKLNMKQLFTYNRIIVGCFLVSAIIAFQFFIYQQKHPPCCDAYSYLSIAESINSIGLIESQVPLRTFAYPLILAGIAKISALSKMDYFYLIFLFQYSIYIIAVKIAHDFFIKNIASDRVKATLFAVLSINIFAIPYFSVSLTDSLYLALCIIIITNICKLSISSNPQYSLIFITFLLTACAIVIRPAAVWLVLPLSLYTLTDLYFKKINAIKLLIVMAISSFPLFIQIGINYSKFGAFTFLPATDLGGSQVTWGIQYIKYATWLGGGTQQNFYPASELINVPINKTELNIGWYLFNPVDGIKLLTVKFIGAFDFDYLVPYPYQKNSNFWIPSFISFFIMFFGTCGVIYHAITNSIISLGYRFLPAIIFCSWGSVTLVSALELRFTLPILIYFIIISVLFIYELNTKGRKNTILILVFIFFVLLPFFIRIASFVRDQSTVAS